jgi:hypothetical protein
MHMRRLGVLLTEIVIGSLLFETGFLSQRVVSRLTSMKLCMISRKSRQPNLPKFYAAFGDRVVKIF